MARSRLRTLWTPIRSIAPAPMTPPPRNPTRGLKPRKNAPEPPVVATSVSAWPAKDWLRTTVKTPTTAETIAVTVPIAAAVRTGPLEKKPGSKRKLMPTQETVKVG